MILGKIVGKITTNNFKFEVEKETKKFEYVQVYHKMYDYVLCQIVEIEKTAESTIAFCEVIGYRDKNVTKKPRIPFDPDSEVLLAEDKLIKDIIKLEDTTKGALIGKLDGRNIDVFLDLNKILTMHLAVLAKSGSGKSYAVGVLLEEMIERKVPILVIDPHGEYSSLRFKNDDVEDIEKLKHFNFEPTGFNMEEFGDIQTNSNARPLSLNGHITSEELIHILPGKLSGNQQAVLYSSLKNSQTPTFDSLLLSLEQEESNAKFGVMNMVEYLKNLEIFNESPTPYNELVKPGRCNILNLKGINPDVQQLIVYKISRDLFELRKKNKIPPFFLVIEEAHNYCPERSFGEAKSSKVIRNIASEGRKFGLGLCIISQRPARVDKSVLSQCSTQIILKVTNPNDLKAISTSIEGLTSSTEKEIQNLTIGTAMVTGLSEVPLLVNIRPKKSRHGGRAQDVLNHEANFDEKLDEFNEEDLLPLIKPNTSPKDIILMSEREIKEINTILISCYNFQCKDASGTYSLLVEMINGEIIIDKENFATKKIPDMKKLTKKQINILKHAFKNKSFSQTDLIQGLGSDLDVTEDLTILQELGYLSTKKDIYFLSNDYVFSKLSGFKFFDKPEFENIKYSTKLEAKVNLDKLIDKLSKFTSIIDKNECFFVKYKSIY